MAQHESVRIFNALISVGYTRAHLLAMSLEERQRMFNHYCAGGTK